MKKSLFTVALFIIAAPPLLFGQHTDDVTVYLRNGSKIIGELFEMDKSGRMTVETPNGTTVCFTEKAVDEIVYDDDNIPINRSFRRVSTVSLRNGSLLIGRLTELENDKLKLETPNGSIIYFTQKSITDIERDEIQSISANNRSRRYEEPIRGGSTFNRYETSREPEPQYKTRGYRGFVELGYSVGFGDYKVDRIELSTSHGYQFNPYLFLGGGLAEHYYHESEGFLMPLFVDFRANFTNTPAVPFFGLKVGYSIGLSSDFVSSGGAYFAPALGVKFKTGYSFAINITAGYTYQSVDVYDYDYYSGYYDDDISLSAFSLKLGIEF